MGKPGVSHQQHHTDAPDPKCTQVRPEISDSQGRSIETLINGQMDAGSHSATWDGSGHSPGM
jgi:flagellar hook assembly protein FlgD